MFARRPPRPHARLTGVRPLAAALLALAACDSHADLRALTITSVTPRCAHAGDTLTLTLEGGDPMLCAAAKVLVGERELEYLGQTRGSPLTLEARLPAGFEPPAGAELKVVCAAGSSPGRWTLAGCQDADRSDARRSSPDAAAICASPIAAVVQAVDSVARPFPRDAEGRFLVPRTTTDFSFATDGSQNVSPANVTYTFSSDCYPTLAVTAPVLGGLSATALEPDRLCDFMVAIRDEDCPGPARTGGAAGTFRVVP
jgi:hypothetical protein